MNLFTDEKPLYIKNKFVAQQYLDSAKSWILNKSMNPDNSLQPEFDIHDDNKVYAKKIRRLYWNDKDFWEQWINCSRLIFLVKEFIKDPLLIKHAAFIKHHIDESYIPLHQDIALWETPYKSAITFWIAVTNSTKENGGMFYYPCISKIYHHEFDIKYPSFKSIPEHTYNINSSEFKNIEVEAGGVVIWPSIFPHGSHQNSIEQLRIGMPLVFIEKQEASINEKEKNYAR